MFNQIVHKKSGFTLMELIISMTLFSLIMISVFDSVANIGFARIQSTQRISLIEELYFFSEKFTTAIKEGGTIDYEEYWGRMVMGTGITDGHYTTGTLFGNFGFSGIVSTGAVSWGDGPYDCRSGTGGSIMGTGGCLRDNNRVKSYGDGTGDLLGKPQRYLQYRLQFIDFNSNRDPDLGDEDGDGSLRGDEDDLELGDGPEVIQNPMAELYLINLLKNERLYFRVQYKNDPNKPSGVLCDTDTGIGSGCLGNIQVLKMSGKDIGIGTKGETGQLNGAFDGFIDTWECHPDWRCTGKDIEGAYGTVSFGADADWVDFFPDYINVKSLRFDIYPLKNPWYAWNARDDLTTAGFVSPFIHPYVKVQLTLGFAWERRSIIRNDDPTITLSTTLSLDDYTN